MSSLGDQVVSIAYSQIGTKEGPNNSQKYSTYFGVNNVSWCAYFVMWCYAQAGYNTVSKGFTGNCSSWLKAKNVSTIEQAQPGDVVVFVFEDGRKQGLTAQHVGIFYRHSSNGRSFQTIEGNTKATYDGVTFEGVHERTRCSRDVVGIVRLSGSSGGSSKGYFDSTNGGALTESDYQERVNLGQITPRVRYEEITTERVTDSLLSADVNVLQRTQATSLLSIPTLVETPFIILKIGDYTFGQYLDDSSSYSSVVKQRVTYPNYMTSLDVVKVNGTVNQYVLTLQYQISAGDDPNRLDKIFSSVGYGSVYISYGDWSSPTFIYKEEEAIITKLASNVDFSNSRITYQLYCTSNSTTLLSNVRNFPERNAKPSDVILELLYTDSTTGLLDTFYGMKSRQEVISKTLIPTNDKVVNIPAKEATDVLSYINFLVTCMIANTNKNTDAIQDSSYYMSVYDDVLSEFGGPYFKITQVISEDQTLNSIDTYELDVGYPGDSPVLRFNINDDQSWALLYDYSENIPQQEYQYWIDDLGILNTQYSSSLTTSSKYHLTTASQKSWWTNMTQFPVRAEITLKGLLRPAMLMTYVRINSTFYGQRHISSGLYIVTKQQDRVDSSGYRTTLQLTKIAGDTDYVKRTKQKVVSKIPIIVKSDVSSVRDNLPANSYTYASGNTYTSSQYDLSKLTETEVRDLQIKGSDIKLVKQNKAQKTANKVTSTNTGIKSGKGVSNSFSNVERV